MANAFDYSGLEPWEVADIKIGKKDYVLREPTAGGVAKWRNAQMRGAKYTEDGKLVGIEGYADADIVLVAECLSEVTPNGDKPVEAGTVRGFRPGRIARELFDAIVERSPWILAAPKKGPDDPKGADGGSNGTATTGSATHSDGSSTN